MIDVFIGCVPPKVSHHHKQIVNHALRDGRSFARLADRKELVAAKASWIDLLMPHAPPAPIPAPVLLSLELTWPWRSSDSKRARLLGRIPCIVKPDADNLAKTITDCLVMVGYIAHDAEVSDLHVTKWIGNQPGLRLVMQTIELGTGAVPTLTAPLFEGAAR